VNQDALPSVQEMREFLEYVEIGDPIKDRWDEEQLVSWLVAFMKSALSLQG
jgi:hypothetical protein